MERNTAESTAKLSQAETRRKWTGVVIQLRTYKGTPVPEQYTDVAHFVGYWIANNTQGVRSMSVLGVRAGVDASTISRLISGDKGRKGLSNESFIAVVHALNIPWKEIAKIKLSNAMNLNYTGRPGSYGR